MRLSRKHSRSKLEVDRRLARQLEKIRLTLGLDRKAWVDRLQLTEKQYNNVVCLKSSLPGSCLLGIAENLNLSVESLVNAEVDCTALGEHQKGNIGYLPEKYEVAAFSRMRTLANVLNFIERRKGWAHRQSLLRKFQINEVAVKDHDKLINVVFLTDVLKRLRTQGMGDHDFFELGTTAIFTNRHSHFAEEIRSIGKPAQIYEHVFVHRMAFLEKNCDYKLISLKKDICIVESRANKDVAEALRLKRIGSRDSCQQRAGVMSSTIGYANLPYAEVREVACEHRGDPQCKFEIDYRKALWHMKHAREKISRDSSRDRKQLLI